MTKAPLDLRRALAFASIYGRHRAGLSRLPMIMPKTMFFLPCITKGGDAF